MTWRDFPWASVIGLVIGFWLPPFGRWLGLPFWASVAMPVTLAGVVAVLLVWKRYCS